MLLFIFHFSFFPLPWKFCSQLVSLRHLLFLFMCDFIFLKGNINNPRYVLLALFAVLVTVLETRLPKTNDMLLFIFHFSFFPLPWKFCSQLVSLRHLLFLFMCDFIFLKGNINNPRYVLLALFAVLVTCLE